MNITRKNILSVLIESQDQVEDILRKLDQPITPKLKEKVEILLSNMFDRGEIKHLGGGVYSLVYVPPYVQKPVKELTQGTSKHPHKRKLI